MDIPVLFFRNKSALFFEPVFPLTVFPHDKHRSSDEDRGICPHQEPHQQNDGKISERRPAEKRHGEQHEFRRHQLGVNRTFKRLYDGVVDKDFIIRIDVVPMLGAVGGKLGQDTLDLRQRVSRQFERRGFCAYQQEGCIRLFSSLQRGSIPGSDS